VHIYFNKEDYLRRKTVYNLMQNEQNITTKDEVAEGIDR